MASPGTTFDPNTARLLATNRHNGALSSGQAYTVTLNVSLPQAIYGNYYLFLKTDFRTTRSMRAAARTTTWVGQATR